jgi:hypothetical protein
MFGISAGGMGWGRDIVPDAAFIGSFEPLSITRIIQRRLRHLRGNNYIGNLFLFEQTG